MDELSEREKRGQLKIFFGYAAGVGKTYAMLQAAHLAKQQGVDVVVGYVESYGRPRTEELLKGLECVNAKKVIHNHIEMKELDLDAVMNRHPQLVLVDELAHTNGAESRNRKRYQDVNELLKAGIDVYTTVNVQQIESLNDMVVAITGAKVRECIPDTVFDHADEVELVDIEPKTLITRLHTGEIYQELRTKKALSNFFRIENLVSLREIAVQRCAERTNSTAEAIPYPNARTERGRMKFHPFDVCKSLGILVIATLIGMLFFKLGFSEANIIMVYILGVLVTSILTTGRFYSMASSLLSVLIFNFFFTVPIYTFNAYDSGYPITFLIMFASAFITSSLTVKIKQHAKQSAETAYRTKILLETNQLLQQAKEKSGIIAVTGKQLTKLLEKDVVFYEMEKEGLSSPKVFQFTENQESGIYTTEQEKAVAIWVLRNNKHAGATTNTLGNAKCLYLAIRVNDSVYGVVGIVIGKESLEEFEYSIMLSVLGECALALENQQIMREKSEAAILAKNEQLRANLLRSISHDLRTPLTSISGNAGILIANSEKLGEEKKQQLYVDIYDDSLWLINLVENLLSVTRIEDGTMNLKLTAELMEEVIEEALLHINRQSAEHTISVNQSEEFILAKMDVRLIVQVIINIVDNAIKYTPKHSTIAITVSKQRGQVIVEIADNGEGIPEESKERIFDMFYTDNTKIADSRRSLGLGLALCKSIITAHGGEIFVRDNRPKGAVFTFTLPAEEVTIHE
ncbi:MAG: sensor histidine kinase KdpD [Lachnospiraceae bacterium]